MGLDIFIIGPGFGETIILRWRERGKVRGGLIDCYGSNNGRTVIERLKQLRISHLDFIVVTHPHLDHVFNLDRILRAWEGRVGRFWWWGGLDSETYIEYFDRLAFYRGKSGDTLSRRAKSVRTMLVERRRQFLRLGRPTIESVRGCACIHPIGGATSELSITSLSPWGDEILKFTKEVADGIGRGHNIVDSHRACNRISSALLIEFGKAQIVLGGDVESENWEAYKAGSPLKLTPCVVKVSHHGSSTGITGDMWARDGLFSHRPGDASAIVTPWHRSLPEEGVIQQIADHGWDVYITGQGSDPKTEFRFENLESHVHIRVEKSGAHKVVSTSSNVRKIPGRLVH